MTIPVAREGASGQAAPVGQPDAAVQYGEHLIGSNTKDQGTPCSETDIRLAQDQRQQEHFLFELIRLGQLPMRNILVLGCTADRIRKCLAENYPAARLDTLEPDAEQIQNARHPRVNADRIGFEQDIPNSNPPHRTWSYDVVIAVEVFQGQTRTRVRALVEMMAAVSRYIVNIDWSEPWPWKTPDGLWCHEYQSLYAEAGLNCATFLLPEKTGGLQQKLFVVSRRMTPEMVRLMDKAEEDLGGY